MKGADIMFDKKLFKELLKEAIGDKSIAQYARECGVDRSYLSRFLNLKLDNPPQPETLEKIAKNTDKLTYEDLMLAAGYYSGKSNDLILKYLLMQEEKTEVIKKLYYQFKSEKIRNKASKEGTVPVIRKYKGEKKSFYAENIINYLTFPRQYTDSKSFAIYIKDNQLEKMGIYKGDYVLINIIENKPKPGDTLYLELNGDTTIKRYYPLKDQIRLEPDYYNNRPINKDDIYIIGRAVFLQRKFY